MATNDKDIGSFGNIAIAVSLQSQDQAANTSTILVVGTLKNNGNSGSFANGANWSLSGIVSDSGSFNLNVAAFGSQTVVSKTFTVSHDPDGSKSGSVTFTVGGFNTTTFGTGGNVTVSFDLPKISRYGKRRSGSTYVDLTIARRRSGSSWVDVARVRRYNGSTWVDVS